MEQGPFWQAVSCRSNIENSGILWNLKVNYHRRFEVLTAILLEVKVLRDFTSWRLLNSRRRFGEVWCLLSVWLPVPTASHPTGFETSLGIMCIKAHHWALYWPRFIYSICLRPISFAVNFESIVLSKPTLCKEVIRVVHYITSAIVLYFVSRINRGQ